MRRTGALLILAAFLLYALAAAVLYPRLGRLYLPALAAPRIAAAALLVITWASAGARGAPRVVTLLLAGGNALGLLGAWLLGDPWRDWALAQGLTAAEYVAAGVVMWREWSAGRG